MTWAAARKTALYLGGFGLAAGFVRRGLVAEPPAHEHAKKLLKARGQSVKRIVRVDRDEVLFVNSQGKARTAFIEASTDDKGRQRTMVNVVDGFPA